MRNQPIEQLEPRRLLATFVVDTSSAFFDDSDGLVSLAEAVAAANSNAAAGDAPAGDAEGDVITFDPSIDRYEITYRFDRPLAAISDDLVIDGSGTNVTINYFAFSGGSNNFPQRPLRIDTDQSVRLANLNIGGATNGGAGGGLEIRGGGQTVLDTVTVSGVQGIGGVSIDGGGLTVRDSTFRDNSSRALRRPDGFPDDMTFNDARRGGAIVAEGADVTIVNSLLSGNNSAGAGGAIEFAGDGALMIRNSAFRDNFTGDARIPGISAGPGNGGAVHVTGAGTVNVDSSIFTGNTAAAEGGALWNSADSTMTVVNSLLTNNTAAGGVMGNGGGAIYNNGGVLSVDTSGVTNNAATGAAGSGGGIINPLGTTTITNSFVSNNTSNRAGGGIEVGMGSVSIFNSRLDGNATNGGATGAPGNGGGLHVTFDADVSVTDSLVDGNLAAAEGGGLWNSATGTMSVVNSGVINNVANGDDADNGGGGLFNNGGTLDLLGSFVSANAARGSAGSGGGLLSVAGDVSVVDSLVSRNLANRAGGGVEIIDGSITFDNSGLSQNGAGVLPAQVDDGTAPLVAAPGNGGGLHVSGMDNTLVFTTNGTEILGNVAASEGGGLWNQAGSALTVEDSVITQNQAFGDDATNGGGGIFNNGGDVIVSNSNVDLNSALGLAGSGGGIFSTGGAVAVADSSIRGNTAVRAGGGVEVIDGSVALDAVQLQDNLAGAGRDFAFSGPGNPANPGNGGGLHVTGSDGTEVIVSSSSVTGNGAENEGGGLWNQSGSLLTVIDSDVSDNVAAGDGGGLYNNGGDLGVDNTAVNGNTAGGNGGGAFNAAGGTALFSSTLIANNAAASGGGIFTANGAVTTLVDSVVADNDPDNLAGPGTVA